MITTQVRATNSINRVFRFQECHPSCGCNKDMCLNYLMAAGNKKHFNLQIRRVVKGPATMWGLYAMEVIPQGAYILEYRGEVVTKKQGDMRGSYYDSKGLSYLFDMNDPNEDESREADIQLGYHGEFFPLCLDSMFYGNESRFINHSCDPNCQSFNLGGQVESQTLHRIGLFSSRKILVGEELTMDYSWD